MHMKYQETVKQPVREMCQNQTAKSFRSEFQCEMLTGIQIGL